MSDMTRDDIIRMAQEAMRERFSDGGHWFSMEVRDLERFAALVAAAENSRCARINEDYARHCRDAGWDSEAATLRDAAKQMRSHDETAIWSARNDPRE